MKIVDFVHFKDLPNGSVTVNSPAFALERTGFCLSDATRDIRSAIQAAFARGVRPISGLTEAELRRLGFRNLMSLEVEVD